MGILNFLLKLIEQIFGFDIEINQNEQLIQSFLAKAPYSLSLAIVAIIATAAIYVIIIQLIKFIKTIQENKISKLKILFVITLLSVIIASFIVHGIKEVSAEQAVFIDDNDQPIENQYNEKSIFIGEIPHFRWKFDENGEIERKLENQGKHLRYKLSYFHLKTNDRDYNILETKVKYFNAMNLGDMRWQVIPGFCKNNDFNKCKANNNFVPLSKFNNSDFLETTYYPSLSEKIKDKKVFRVLTTGLPNRGYFSFNNHGKTQGFDYSLAKAIKTELFGDFPDVGIDFKPEPWEKLFTIMKDGKVADIAINTISNRKDREVEYKIKFSEPYQEDITLSLIISEKNDISLKKSSNKDILSLLEGKKVGVLNDSTAEKTLIEFNKILSSKGRDIIKIYPSKTSQNSIYDLDKHKTNFVLVDTPYVEAITLNPLYKVKSLLELTPDLYPIGFPNYMIGEDYSVVVNPGHIEFLDDLNEAIKRLKNKGLVSRIESRSKKLYEETFLANKKCLAASEKLGDNNLYCSY